MNMLSPRILKKAVNDQGLHEFLARPRNRTILIDKKGGFRIFDLHDADYMKRFYKNKIDVPDLIMRNSVVPDTRIKIHASWPMAEDEIFWVNVGLVDILPTGEKVFYAVTEYSTDQVPSGVIIGPIGISNICDMDLKNSLYTDGYQLAALQNGEENA